MISNQEQYINLSTRKRDGSFVDTPVWFAQEGETNNYYVFSMKNAGKIKKLRIINCLGFGGINFAQKKTGLKIRPVFNK